MLIQILHDGRQQQIIADMKKIHKIKFAVCKTKQYFEHVPVQELRCAFKQNYKDKCWGLDGELEHGQK